MDDIIMEFDPPGGDYCTFWNPPAALGAGKTASEAVEDMRSALHACIDTLLDLKLKELRNNRKGQDGDEAKV